MGVASHLGPEGHGFLLPVQGEIQEPVPKFSLENPYQGNHEAGAGQKRHVGFSVPVIPGDQSPPVVEPPVAPLYLPATLADLMDQGRSTRPFTTVLPLPLRYGWLNPSSAKLPPEISAVVTFVST